MTLPDTIHRGKLYDKSSSRHKQISRKLADWLQVIQGDSEEEEEGQLSSDSQTGSPEGSGSSSTGEDTEENDHNPELCTSEAEREIVDFERQEIDHEVVFSLHKRMSCFSHTLQLVVRKFDTITSPKRSLQSASR